MRRGLRNYVLRLWELRNVWLRDRVGCQVRVVLRVLRLLRRRRLRLLRLHLDGM